MNNILSIDPSINNTGYAVHSSKGKLIKYGLFVPSKKLKKRKDERDSYIDRSLYIARKIRKLHKKYDAIVVLEVPQYWGVKGYLARESGSIFKLTFLCGVICGMIKNVIIYVPQDWKGQMPKKVVQNRLQKIYKNIDFSELKDDTVDAIGIGRFYVIGKI